MSPDDFFVSNSNKTELVLSYVFQLRKQGRKSFFRHFKTLFFLKNFLPKDRSFRLKKKPLILLRIRKKYSPIGQGGIGARRNERVKGR